jgi:hypothetical protein
VEGIAGKEDKLFSRVCGIEAEVTLAAVNHLGTLANSSDEAVRTSASWCMEENNALELLFFTTVFTVKNS